jgi:hypothetical protein
MGATRAMRSSMKKKKISTYYLSSLLHFLIEDMHEDLSLYEGLNLINRASVRHLVEGYLKPRYQELPLGQQFRVKESLRYGLNAWSEETLQNCFPETDCLFTIPRGMTARELYQQIWDDLFDGEDCALDDAQAYEEIPYDNLVMRR